MCKRNPNFVWVFALSFTWTCDDLIKCGFDCQEHFMWEEDEIVSLSCAASPDGLGDVKESFRGSLETSVDALVS